MTTPNPMEGRRVTSTANDPEAAMRFPGTSGDYWMTWEQDTDEGTAEVLHLGHRLADELPAGSPTPRYPHQWKWCAYAVWPKGEPGVPAIYEWVGGRWTVNDEPVPSQRHAVAAVLMQARARNGRA